MPRGGWGVVNYGEAEFRTVQLHRPVHVLQLKGCKQERDKAAGRALPSGTTFAEVAFPSKNKTFELKAAAEATQGQRGWQGARRRRG